jgi:hypothetical protein
MASVQVRSKSAALGGTVLAVVVWKVLSEWCRRWGSNPHETVVSRDFEDRRNPNLTVAKPSHVENTTTCSGVLEPERAGKPFGRRSSVQEWSKSPAEAVWTSFSLASKPCLAGALS